MKVAERERFVALDAWRGICAIFIVIFQFVSVMPSVFKSSTFILNSYLFVDFFFVLSGFVLCHSYAGKIDKLEDAVRFAIRRFGRIWPLHALVLLVFVGLIAAIAALPHPHELTSTWNSGSYSVSALLPSFLLLNAMGLQASSWNGPAWSIGAEFYTYLIFAAIVLAIGRRTAAVAIVLSAAALAFLVWRAPDIMNTTWDYGFVRCIAGFFGGGAAYQFYRSDRPFRPIKATAVELVAVVLVIAFVVIAGSGPDNVSVVSTAAPAVFGAAVVIFASEQGLLSLLFRMPAFRALGRYSFSIYMIHMPMLIMFCYGVWLTNGRTMAFQSGVGLPALKSSDLLLVNFVLAVVLVSVASYHFIETPARRYINRVADRAIVPRRLAFRGKVSADMETVTVSGKR
jgi:peptidoglycan/LPS O-acetylase OafA/YrhL